MAKVDCCPGVEVAFQELARHFVLDMLKTSFPDKILLMGSLALRFRPFTFDDAIAHGKRLIQTINVSLRNFLFHLLLAKTSSGRWCVGNLDRRVIEAMRKTLFCSVIEFNFNSPDVAR